MRGDAGEGGKERKGKEVGNGDPGTTGERQKQNPGSRSSVERQRVLLHAPRGEINATPLPHTNRARFPRRTRTIRVPARGHTGARRSSAVNRRGRKPRVDRGLSRRARPRRRSARRLRSPRSRSLVANHCARRAARSRARIVGPPEESPGGPFRFHGGTFSRRAPRGRRRSLDARLAFARSRADPPRRRTRDSYFPFSVRPATAGFSFRPAAASFLDRAATV